MGLFSGIKKVASGIGGFFGSKAVSGLTGAANAVGGLLNPTQQQQGQGNVSSPNGISGQFNDIYDKATKAAENTRKALELKDEISRMADPVGYAAKQGRADRAFHEAKYPGVNAWERVGAPGIQGTLGAASVSGSASTRFAGISTQPAHREQERRDRMERQNLALLDAQTQKMYKEMSLLMNQSTTERFKSKSEARRAEFAEVREQFQSMPQNPISLGSKAADNIGKWYGQADENVRKWFGQASENSVKWVGQASQNSGAWVRQAQQKIQNIYDEYRKQKRLGPYRER